MSDPPLTVPKTQNATQPDTIQRLSAEVERLTADLRAKEDALALKESKFAAKSQEVEGLRANLHSAENTSRELKHTSASKKWLYFERACRFLELFSFTAIIITAPVAYFGFRDNVQHEQEVVAERIYSDVDSRYADYIKLSIAYPRLDGYSVPRPNPVKPPLTEDEKTQQRILYSNLTDVFEVAYIQYHKTRAIPEEVRENFYNQQWPGWDAYIRKFLVRPAYQKVWLSIQDEYDRDFARYMNGLLADIASKSPGASARRP